MKKYVIRWLIASLMMSGTAWAQEPTPEQVALGRKLVAEATQETRPFSRKLGIAGVVVALGGVAVLGPWGTPVTVVDTTYCVTDAYNVYEGGCNARGKQAMIGAAMLGGGILLAWTGLRSVKVKSQVSKTRKAVAVSVEWGGARAQQR
jgi:hypothetical protein